MIYIGDLSSRDAAVLARAARCSFSILEFGVGASTQIFAQFAPPRARIVSLDTSGDWIARTTAILDAMQLRSAVTFRDYVAWTQEQEISSAQPCYDLLFDDGIDALRLDFALRAWPRLKVGGQLIFHDTRRQRDWVNVLQFASAAYPEIRSIEANKDDSNLTVVTKQQPVAYENWNATEGRSPLMVGCAPLDATIAFVESALAAP